MTHGLKFQNNGGQRADDAVHLGLPGVRYNKNTMGGCWREHAVDANYVREGEGIRQLRRPAPDLARRTTDD
jgi:hypothetical protein